MPEAVMISAPGLRLVVIVAASRWRLRPLRNMRPMTTRMMTPKKSSCAVFAGIREPFGEGGRRCAGRPVTAVRGGAARRRDGEFPRPVLSPASYRLVEEG